MPNAAPPKPREVKIRVRDGVEIAVALCMPAGDGRFPALFRYRPLSELVGEAPAAVKLAA